MNGILNLVRCFEETRSLENRPQSDRPALRAGRVHVIQSVMEDLAAETSTVSSSACEAKERTEPSIRCILHRMLDLYPYKIQAPHQLLSADTGATQNFATWALTQMECNPQWLLHVMWTDEAHFSLHGDMNTQNSRIRLISNLLDYHSQPLHSSFVNYLLWVLQHLLFWGHFCFEEPCPVSGRNPYAVTLKRYLMLLHDHVVPALQERHALSVVTFMQDGAPLK